LLQKPVKKQKEPTQTGPDLEREIAQTTETTIQPLPLQQPNPPTTKNNHQHNSKKKKKPPPLLKTVKKPTKKITTTTVAITTHSSVFLFFGHRFM
jgi:hypothetical protein